MTLYRFSLKRWVAAVGPWSRRNRSGGGFGGFFRQDPANADDSEVSRLPSVDAPCACSSGSGYGGCCRRFHTDAATPSSAVDLLRARYSAYAYRLPAYIMRTTHESTAERDRRKWRDEIMDFATSYRFVDGLDIIEQNVTSAETTTILFRAKLRRRTQPVSFMEMSKFVKENSNWYYLDGKLVDVDDSEESGLN